MLFFAAAVLAALLPSFILTAPVADFTDWTYNHVYQYAVKRGGSDDPVASLIARHVETTKRGWDDVYQHNIKINSGATLTIAKSPAGRLFRRANFPNGAIEAFPYASACDGDVSFTWSPVDTDGCYTYDDNGENIRMYSAQVSGVYANGDGPELIMFQDSQSCGIFHTFDNRWTWASSQCFSNANNGRGFMSWELLWPHASGSPKK
jgi:hypothetical protein